MASVSLIPQAKIMTIDSFCLDLIRNHYNALDIDPAFRIGDEGELTLLKGDVMEQVLEECTKLQMTAFYSFRSSLEVENQIRQWKM